MTAGEKLEILIGEQKTKQLVRLIELHGKLTNNGELLEQDADDYYDLQHHLQDVLPF